MTDETAARRERQKVLIIDDTLANIELLYQILEGDFVLFFSKNGSAGLRVALRELPDLILLDIMMPDMDGYQVCKLLKEDPRTARIPVVFVTALGSLEDEARGLECGAIDYITKPISPPIVKARVKNHLKLKYHRDLQEKLSLELGEKNRELEELARKDGLTGLANRRNFDEVLDAEIKRAFRSRQFLSLIMCDVDLFKCYNDHYGHPAGDRCLQEVAAIMLATFRRAGDLPARYGGEEFAVILPDTPPDKAAQLAELFREELAARSIPHATSTVLGKVTLSAGVVGAQIAEGWNAQRFIEEADQAMYRSKAGGRNRVTLAGMAAWVDG